MPTINFTKFIDKVESGEKRQTIRAIRKRPIKVGDKLYLYSGLRTKGARNLLIKHIVKIDMSCHYDMYGKSCYITCKEVHEVEMYYSYHWEGGSRNKFYNITIDNKNINNRKRLMLAKADGFNSYKEMFNWFEKTHGLPFKGQLIKW